MQLLPNGKQSFFDNNGDPLAGGTVTFYIPGTTTEKDTWQDRDQSALNTNPVVLDAGGRAVIWGSGAYRQVVKDSLGNLIWDQIVATSPYEVDLAVSVDTPIDGQEVVIAFVRSYTLPADADGSYGKSRVAATAETTLNLIKNTTTIGTVVWAAAGTVPTFTVAADVSFDAEDILVVQFPETKDTTLAKLGITFKLDIG